MTLVQSMSACSSARANRCSRTTLREHFGPIKAANLRRAHALIESGQAQGKIGLEGFDTSASSPD